MADALRGYTMGHRSFTDSRGTEWQAWDVVPRLAERRVSERRTHVAHPIPAERRLRFDRRILAGFRSVLYGGLNEGWLCFEASSEKRRLTPIPQDWLSCAKEQLERYCAGAKQALRPRSILNSAP